MKLNQERKIRCAHRTRLGRMLCRLAGDQTGAVMMEYVILAVMIAAAATLAAIFFGKQITQAFTTMNHATAGDVGKDDKSGAQGSAAEQKSTADKASTENEKARKNIAGGSGNNAANQ